MSRHTKNGQPFMCPIVRHEDTSVFRLGCEACRSAGLDDAFASFEVYSKDYCQMGSFMRHINSPKHIQACKRLGVEVLVTAKTAAASTSAAANAPATSKFLWGLTSCFTNSSYKDYRKFVRTDEVLRFSAQNLFVPLGTRQRPKVQHTHVLSHVGCNARSDASHLSCWC